MPKSKEEEQIKTDDVLKKLLSTKPQPKKTKNKKEKK